MSTKKNLFAVFSLITALAVVMSVVFVGGFSASAATDDTITVDLSKIVKSGFSKTVDDPNDRDDDGKALKITFPANTTNWPPACQSTQITDLDPAKLYTFSFWYKGDHSESGLWINARAHDELNVQECAFYFTDSKADVWTQVVVKNIAPKTDGTISWNISVKNTKATDITTYLDAITVTEQAEVNLFNFVDDTYSSVVNEDDQDGDKLMLKLVVPANTTGSNLAGNGVTIEDLDPSKKYTVSFWKKGDTLNGSYLSVAGKGGTKTQAFRPTDAEVWTKFTLSDIEPKDDGTIVLNILACSGKTVDSTTYIDALTVTEQDDTITVDLSNFVDDTYSSVVHEEDQDGDNQMLKLVVPANTTGSNLAGNGVTIENLDPSKKYTVSFWKKGDTLNGSYLSVAGKGGTKTQAFSETAAGVWTKFTLSDIEPKDDGTIVLNILACSGKTVDSTTYIDALTVTEQVSNTSDNDTSNDTSFVSTRMIKPGEFAYGTVATVADGGRNDGDNKQLKLSVPANTDKSVPSISITGLDPNKKYTISLWVKGDGFSNGNFWINEANVASGGSGLTLKVPTTTTADWVELKVKDVSPTPTWTVQCGIWLKNSTAQNCVLYADTITVSEQADSSSNPGTDSAIRIACVGDSITHGTIQGGVDYPTQLLGILGEGYTVGNFGVSGSGAMKSHWKSYWTRDAFEMSSNWNPDKVIIMLGTNDAASTWDPDKYVEDLTELVKHYQSLPTAPVVYIATSPTFYDDTQQAITVNTVVCKLQKQVADSLGCTLIDIHTVTQGLEEHFPDTIHPDAEGYKIIANAMADAVTSSGNGSSSGDNSSSKTDDSDGDADNFPNTGDNTVSKLFVAILAMLFLATEVVMVLYRKRRAD